MAGVHDATSAVLTPEQQLTVLPPLEDSPVLDAGAVLSFLNANHITVPGDTVLAKSDGSVHVDLPDSAKLQKLWTQFTPEPPPLSPEDQRVLDLAASLDACTDLETVKAWIKTTVLPIIARG